MLYFKNFKFWIIIKNFFKNNIFKALGIALALNILFGIAFYWAEKEVQAGLKVTDAVWWSVVTMTTVGYGDFYAQTWIGRYLISYPCMFIGIGIIGYLVGSFAEILIENISRKRRGLLDIKLSQHIIICNCPFVEKVLTLVKELRGNPQSSKCKVVVISDQLEIMPEEFKENEIHFLKGDPAREEILEKANLNSCQGVFILAKDPRDYSSDEKTYLIASIIQMIKNEQQSPYKVIVELMSNVNKKMLEKLKVDGIITSEGFSGCLMAQEYLYPGVYGIIQQLISNQEGSELYIFNTILEGHKVVDLQIAAIEHPQNVQILGIIRGDQYILNPDKSMMIREQDKIILLAESYNNFNEIEQSIAQK